MCLDKIFWVFKQIKFINYVCDADLILIYQPLLELSFNETDNIADIPFFFKQDFYLNDILIDLWEETVELPIGNIIF
jgi:hypothetical protein